MDEAPDIKDGENAACSNNIHSDAAQKKHGYVAPVWSGVPSHHYSLEVLKNGQIVETIDLEKKPFYKFGRQGDCCDIVCEHPSISREHAVLQFRSSGEAYAIDLGSANGTKVNKRQLKPNVYAQVYVGYVFQFGQSTRSYILQGPPELMNPEKERSMPQGVDSSSTTASTASKVKQMEEQAFRTQQIEKAKRLALMAQKESEGASWGFGEDAEEDSDDENQGDYTVIMNYASDLRESHKLTEKQLALLEKMEKKHSKIERIRMETKKIRQKETAGELSAGQLAQISRNEEKIEQVEVVLGTMAENLQALIAKHIKNSDEGGDEDANMPLAMKKQQQVESDDDDSEEDDFFDRTGVKRKRKGDQAGGSGPNGQQQQQAHTYMSLRAVQNAMMEQREKLQQQIADIQREDEESAAGGGGEDAIDNYLIQIAKEGRKLKIKAIQKEIVELAKKQEQNDRLLKIATPALASLIPSLESRLAVPKQVPAAATPPPPPPQQQQQVSPKENNNNGGAVFAVPPPRLTSQQQQQQPQAAKLGPKPPPAHMNPLSNSMLAQALAAEPKETDEDKAAKLGANAEVVVVKEGELATKLAKVTEPSNKQPKDVPIESGVMGQSSWINESRGGLQKAPQRVLTEAEQKKKRAVGAMLPSHLAGAKRKQTEDEDDENAQDMGLYGQDDAAATGGSNNDFDWKPPEGQTGDGRTKLNDLLGY